MGIVESWTGRYFEDFKVGDIYQHPLGRSVLETDNVWFTCATMNTNQVHFNTDYASKTAYKKPLVNSCFTLALVNGLSVEGTSRNGMVLEWRNVRMPNPLFVGETVYAQTEILEVRESKSRPDRGIVKAATKGITAEGKIILKFERSIMVYKKADAPNTMLFPQTAQ